MAIIRWNPWNPSSLFEDDWEVPTIPGLSRLVGQGLNIYETDSAIVAEAALLGVPEDNIDVTIDEGVVRVTGSTTTHDEDKANRRYYMSSMSSSFNYSFRLPEGTISGTDPACEIENGVLTMTFNKTQKAPPKKVKIVAKKKVAV